jgi:hypothetical protein
MECLGLGQASAKTPGEQSQHRKFDQSQASIRVHNHPPRAHLNWATTLHLLPHLLMCKGRVKTVVPSKYFLGGVQH